MARAVLLFLVVASVAGCSSEDPSAVQPGAAGAMAGVGADGETYPEMIWRMFCEELVGRGCRRDQTVAHCVEDMPDVTSCPWRTDLQRCVLDNTSGCDGTTLPDASGTSGSPGPCRQLQEMVQFGCR